jgi:hypothetical protein
MLTSPVSPFSHLIISIQAQELAEGHVRIARHFPGYYKLLKKIVAYTDYTPGITSHVVVLGLILSHHDLVSDAYKTHFNAMGAKVLMKAQMFAQMAQEHGNNNIGTVPTMAMS